MRGIYFSYCFTHILSTSFREYVLLYLEDLLICDLSMEVEIHLGCTLLNEPVTDKARYGTAKSSCMGVWHDFLEGAELHCSCYTALSCKSIPFLPFSLSRSYCFFLIVALSGISFPEAKGDVLYSCSFIVPSCLQKNCKKTFEGDILIFIHRCECTTTKGRGDLLLTLSGKNLRSRPSHL